VAFSPCSSCRRMYRGGANTFFWNVVEGAYRWSRRRQLCTDCASAAVEMLDREYDQVEYDVPVGENTQPFNCKVCGIGLAFRRRAVFVNVYRRGVPECAFTAQLCVEHSDAVIENEGLEKQVAA
jgi:hypothetical protein